jgi:hypothetical protein
MIVDFLNCFVGAYSIFLPCPKSPNALDTRIRIPRIRQDDLLLELYEKQGPATKVKELRTLFKNPKLTAKQVHRT